MKKILASLCLIGFFIGPVFSQGFSPNNLPEPLSVDGGFLNNVDIKINPLRMLSGLFSGEEYGGTIQFPLIKKRVSYGDYYKVDGYIGGGLNKYFEADPAQGSYPSGYTIRGGIYYFFTKRRHGYLSLQYFFRKWYFNDIIDYPLGANTILSPLSIIGSQGSAPDYRYNATVNINCYDLVYGDQISISESGRIIIDWYIGAGWRTKTIEQTIIGYYHDGQFYTSSDYSVEKDNYPDIKAGFMIGFIL